MPSSPHAGVRVYNNILILHTLANMSIPLQVDDLGVDADRLGQLRTVSLNRLQSASASEQSTLIKACMEDGFFYLDCTQSSLSKILEDVESVFKLSEDLFNYPLDIKTLFDVDKVSDLKVNGYKPKGRNIVSKSGQSDGFESWVVSFQIDFNHTSDHGSLFLPASTKWTSPTLRRSIPIPTSDC